MKTESESQVKARARSFGYAFEGLWYALRTQPNTWIHSIATVLVIGFALWLRVPALGWGVLFVAIGLVWSLELVNTAFEAAIDLVSPDYHPLAKAAKDVSAGAVLLGALGAAAAGFAVMGPPLLDKVAGWF